MDNRTVGIAIVAIGLLAILIGALVAAGWLSWFGRLPGDIRYERDSVRVYVPITSMILISLALTLLSYAIRRFM